MRERRGFGKAAALIAAAEIGLASVGAPSARAAETPDLIRQRDRQEHLETKLPSSIEKELQAYEKQKTALTTQEIQKELSRYEFIDSKPTVYTYAPPPHLQGGFFQAGQEAREALYSYVSIIKTKNDPSQLSAVQVKFDHIGESYAGAFYVPTLKTLFLNQAGDNPSFKRKNLDSFLLISALTLQRGKEKARLLKEHKQGSITQGEMSARLQSIDSDIDKLLDNRKATLSTLSPDTLGSNSNALTNEARQYRWNKERDKIITETNIGHEAFHHFYEHQLDNEGYEGPSMDEILTVALANFSMRFPDAEPTYAEGLRQAIKDYTGNEIPTDQNSIAIVSQRLSQEFDLRTEPPQRSTAEWQTLSEQEKTKEWTHKKIMNFLTEYLARIYNGALGNTPKIVTKKLKENHARFGIDSDPVNFKIEESYHEPTKEELNLLKRMKWHGKSILGAPRDN